MKKLLTVAIRFVLLLPVTSSVIADDLPSGSSPQRQTTNLNLPPESINFDLTDLIDAEQKQREQKQRDEWAKYQAKMTTAYTETQAFTESESDPAAGVEAWQRFLTAFEANNPFGTEDDSMRTRAKDAMLGLEEVERTLQAEWSDYQDKMTKANQEVLAFLKATRDSKLEAQSVNRFLETFTADNPFSGEDELLRAATTAKLTTLDKSRNAEADMPSLNNRESDKGLDQSDHSEGQFGKYSPAYFRDDKWSLKNRIKFPEIDDDVKVAVICDAAVGRTGKFERSYCFSEDNSNRKFEGAVLRAARKARLEPALVNGQSKPIWFQYAVLFQRINGVNEVFVYPHHLHNIKKYGLDYSAPQHYKSPPFVCRRAGVWATFTVTAIGGIENIELLGGQKMGGHKKNCGEIVKRIVSQMEYIPAFHEGRAVIAKVAEMFFGGSSVSFYK